MRNLYTKASRWNEARYDRVLVRELQLELWREEFFDELLLAKTEVDKLDALCDLSFLAAGCLWKMDLSNEHLNLGSAHALSLVGQLLDLDEMHPEMLIATSWATAVADEDYPLDITAHFILVACRVAMLDMGLDDDQCDEALAIVCRSNDTKQVQRVASDTKANINKGLSFIAPEPELQALLNRRRINER